MSTAIAVAAVAADMCICKFAIVAKAEELHQWAGPFSIIFDFFALLASAKLYVVYVTISTYVRTPR